MSMMPQRPDLLQFEVPYPERMSRLLLFIRWFLIIPQLLIIYILGLLLSVIGFVAWWAILITGHYPDGLWAMAMSILRWETRVQIYMSCLRDEYPPFGDEPYPMTMMMAYPGRQSRLLLFFRWLLIIPHMVCLAFVGLASMVALFLMWWGILFTGRPPRGMFDFIVGSYRWGLRVTMYTSLLTDVYPPFSLDE